MIEIKAPNPIPKTNDKLTIFLAGSIEMGAAENWQERIKSLLEHEEIVVLNPRRDDWDSSWVQSIDNAQFREQVEWELLAQEISDIIFMYFVPGTMSPISLLEFGLSAKSGKIVVCCPDGFWRKGNVDIVCCRYDVATVDSIEEFVDNVREMIEIR